MSEYIAFDSHKRYSLVEREDVASGKIVQQVRLTHGPGAVRRYLARCTPGTAVALEATGNWYWIVEEIEQAGLQPRLVHPRKAKLMMGLINKTDKLDVHGLNRLQRNGTLPTVWIPPRPLRDLRELTRTDVNRYLKWAFVEAANSVAVNHRRCPERHVSQLYDRLRQRKGHHKAIGAVARHLAEAAFHVLRRQEAYRDPVLERGCTSEV